MKAVMFVRRLYKLIFGECTLVLGPITFIILMDILKYLYRNPVNKNSYVRASIV